MHCDRPGEGTASDASAELRSDATPPRAKRVAAALLDTRKNAYRRHKRASKRSDKRS